MDGFPARGIGGVGVSWYVWGGPLSLFLSMLMKGLSLENEGCLSSRDGSVIGEIPLLAEK